MKTSNIEAVCRILAGQSKQNHRIILFLGAGCSISSGLPSARDLARSWMRQLQENSNLPAIPDLSLENAGKHYSRLFETLCPDANSRFAEMYRVMRGARPGFAYGALARLIEADHMANNWYPKHLPLVITTNFDDLLEQALAIYTNVRPLLVPTANTIHFLANCFSIIKLHGDYRHNTLNRDKELATLHDGFSTHLGGVLQGATLIFIGYSGNDAGVSQMFSSMREKNFCPSSIYWVNEKIPDNALWKWLQDANDVYHVEHSNFDEIMLRVSELACPRKKMKQVSFHRISESYEDYINYLEHEVSNRVSNKGKMVSQVLSIDGWGQYTVDAMQLAQKNITKAEKKFHDGIKNYPQSAALFSKYGHFLKDFKNEITHANEAYQKTLKIDPDHWRTYGHLGVLMKDYGGQLGDVNFSKCLKYLNKAIFINDRDFNSHVNLAGIYLMQDDLGKAKKQIDQCLEMPLGDKNRMELLFYQLVSGKYESAESQITEDIEALIKYKCRSLNFDFTKIAEHSVSRNATNVMALMQKMTTPVPNC